ncbi:sensor histidine kinase [Aeromicrobium ginsengisoli]|uniref:histidine kinase n=1 Tax=Aeromicrobium ginsengisoli TaxID=363867 RepID=A0A5M4FAH5_9ACTN|nr:sensor histidine kinase [Aeromicrobium ginsengisoli]KAA1395344.1 sensor histidine kinase [Aeromicrobium ginsengisoli]
MTSATRTSPVWSVVGGNPVRLVLSPWPWRSLAYLLTGAVIGLVSLVGFFVTIGVGVVTTPLIIGLFILGALPKLGAMIAVVERRRLPLMLGEAAAPGPSETPWWRTPRDAASWRALGYAVLLALILWAVDALVVVVVVTTVVVSLLSPLLAHYDTVGMLWWQLDSTREALPFAIIATPVGLVLGSYVLTVLAAAQSSLARILLSPREEELEARVTELRRSRIDLVDAFETERKRIERDLHDGVQQRMVALTMLLGRAELDVPEGEGLALVRQAHSEAEAALADLREVVRGVHPRVLTDLGLGAAIREVADRMPIPVRVDVSLDERPPAQVEAAAYFVVSEGLANVAKHAEARSAAIQARRAGDSLVLVVSDDGHGGAVVGEGTGLSGLVTRLDALGGTLTVTSPAGGPTELRMESPWHVDR